MARKAKPVVESVVEPVAEVSVVAQPEFHDGLLVVAKREILVGSVPHWELSLGNNTTTIAPKS